VLKHYIFICLLLHPVITWSQDAASVLKRVYETNRTIQSGMYDYTSKLRFTQSADTVLLHDNHITFSIKDNQTFCRVYDRQTSQITLYDTGIYKHKISLKDSNMYISLKNSPETDQVLYEYTRPHMLFSFADNHHGWYKEAETDTSFILANIENPDPQIVYQSLSRFYIDRRNYIPYKYTEHMMIIEPGVDTTIQYKEQAIRNYRFNLSPLELKQALYRDLTFPSQRIIQSKGGANNVTDTAGINRLITTLKLKATNGTTIDLGNSSSKVIILDFYYSACYPCLLALPVLGRIHRKYTDKEVLIVGINPVDTDINRLHKLLKTKEVAYPSCLDTTGIARSFGITAYPSLLIFDRDKKLVQQLTGYHTALESELIQIIENSLK
jgi:thiol-disulfide isomerase/thioredoxin